MGAPIEDLERQLFQAVDEIPGPIVRGAARSIVREFVRLLRDMERRLAALEERNRHG